MNIADIRKKEQYISCSRAGVDRTDQKLNYIVEAIKQKSQNPLSLSKSLFKL